MSIPMYSTFTKVSGSKKPIHAWDIQTDPGFNGYTPGDCVTNADVECKLASFDEIPVSHGFVIQTIT